MARLLVTGGAGFIGSNLVRYWAQEHPEDRLVVLDALTYAGRTENLDPVRSQPAFRFVQGDIRDQRLVAELLRDEKIDTLVHFAAESHVDRSIAGPDLFIEVNIGGTHSLLKAARAVWLEGPGADAEGCRFHHISTDEVFGSLGPQDPPFKETSRYAPNSPYAASKAASDHLVRAYHRTYGLPVTVSNCSNNFGPYQFPEKLIPLSIVNLLRGMDLPIYGDGANVRDWLHVEDHCRGIERVLRDGRVGATYLIGAACERTNLELSRELCRQLDGLFADRRELHRLYPDCPPAVGESCESRITFVRDRPGHDQRYAVDASRIEEELGFRPRISLESGLRTTLEWYLDHPDWWRGVLDAS